MKKSLAIALFISLSLILTTGISSAMDAKELIEKNIEATGGLEKIKSVNSFLANGKALVQGMELPFVMKQTRPKMMRLEVEIMGMKMIQAFDGEKGWTINPMAGITVAQEMGELENKGFKLQSDMDGVLVDYEDKGYTVEYIGEADVEGTPVYQLRLDTNDDIVMDMFFDQEYFLVIKVSTTINWDEKVIESDSYMSDFQETDGIVIPYSMETRMGENTVNQIVIETVEYGVEIDDEIFVMPVAEAETEAAKTE